MAPLSESSSLYKRVLCILLAIKVRPYRNWLLLDCGMMELIEPRATRKCFYRSILRANSGCPRLASAHSTRVSTVGALAGGRNPAPLAWVKRTRRSRRPLPGTPHQAVGIMETDASTATILYLHYRPIFSIMCITHVYMYVYM